MTTYFLSGLGADKRVFDKLSLPEHLNIVHIDWIPNLTNESLESYVKRLSSQIDTTEPFQIVGLSFGGIVATELSKIMKPRQIIIISSVSTSHQLPWYFKFSGQFLLNPIIPSSILKSSNPMTHWVFGARSTEEKAFFKQILDDADSVFLRWAIEKITTWKNVTRAENLFHIHGSADKTFPMMFMKPDHVIEGGGHFMVYNKHEEISKLLAIKLDANDEE
jgi:esterase/lipase